MTITRRIIIGFIAVSLMLIPCGVSFAAEMNLNYTASENFASVQGTNCWYYQINSNGVYTDMQYDRAQGRWSADNVGGAFITSGGMHPGSSGVGSARVWEAPMPGIVTMESNGNVRKTGIGGTGVTTTIYVNGKSIWSNNLSGTDSVGYNYNLTQEVKAGDRICFEVTCESTSYAATAWNPTVTYKEAAAFTAGNKTVKSMSDVKRGDTLTCTLYDDYAVTESACAYLVLYDESGRMRGMSEPHSIDFENSADKSAEVSFAVNAEANTYKGWRTKLIVLTDTNGRYYPLKISDNLYLD